MARSYKRDKSGRFAGGGGGVSAGAGGKMGKSAKNDKARAKYKEASGKARETTKMAAKIAASPKSSARQKAYWNRQAGGAKSGLTRVSNNLSGKKASTKKAPSKSRRK